MFPRTSQKLESDIDLNSFNMTDNEKMTPPTRFLIAGATGRQGSAAVTALLTDPSSSITAQNIFAVTRSHSGPSAQGLLSRYPEINIVSGDLNDPKALYAQLDSSTLPQTAVFLAQAYGPTEISDVKGLC